MNKKLIFLFLIPITFALSAQNAHQWRGENRDGIYNETGLLKTWPEGGPEMLWHFDDLGPGHASATIANGKVFTGGVDGEKGFVIAFTMDGKQIWKTIYGNEWMENWDGIRTTPTYNDGKIYMFSGVGVVICLEAETGNKLWSVDLIEKYNAKNIMWGMTENLLIYDDQLICMPGGEESNIISLNKNTGELIWANKAKGESSAYCSPQLINHNGKRIIVTHSANDIVALDAKNGMFLWSFPWTTRYPVHPNTPLYNDGKLFCVSGYGKGIASLEIAPDGKSVKELWSNKSLDSQMGGFVLLNGNIYGSGQNSRKWVCLDSNTGKELFANKDIKAGNIIAAEGMLYWYGQDGKVALVEPDETSFNIKGIFEVPYGEKQHWAHLVIDNKRLYVRHGTSLMVYNIAE